MTLDQLGLAIPKVLQDFPLVRQRAEREYPEQLFFDRPGVALYAPETSGPGASPGDRLLRKRSSS